MSLRIVRLLAPLALLAAPPTLPADGGHEGHRHDADNPHIRMTAPRAPSEADEARYRALEATVRRDLARYRDVGVAIAEGFEMFMPGVKQREYHFTKKWNGFSAALLGFDPLKPTSLLYQLEPDGRYTLTGVMYTAAASADEAELDRRVPVSMAQWHQHVNLCVPGPTHRERWTETRDGRPVFGPKSPIATKEGCDAVGGRFVPRLFGWMVHVEAFDRG